MVEGRRTRGLKVIILFHLLSFLFPRETFLCCLRSAPQYESPFLYLSAARCDTPVLPREISRPCPALWLQGGPGPHSTAKQTASPLFLSAATILSLTDRRREPGRLDRACSGQGNPLPPLSRKACQRENQCGRALRRQANGVVWMSEQPGARQMARLPGDRAGTWTQHRAREIMQVIRQRGSASGGRGSGGLWETSS